MIELGKMQSLVIMRKTKIGAYLNLKTDKDKTDVLLPNNQLSQDMEIGHEVEVFVYKDSQDRIISTLKRPKLIVGEIGYLKAVQITNIGAFLDWGLEKDILLPFREQVGKVEEDGTYLVGLYIDKTNRLCATMKLGNMLSTESPFKENDRVKGTIYSFNKELGAFVAVEDKYQGLIPNKELYGSYKEGDKVEARVKRVKQDGKLELSLRQEAYNEIEGDAQKIMSKLKQNKGKLTLNDNSSPEIIKIQLNMSKAAFKRAVGRLLKEGAIRITTQGIELTWKQ